MPDHKPIPFDDALKRLVESPPQHKTRTKDERKPDEDDVIEPHEDVERE